MKRTKKETFDELVPFEKARKVIYLERRGRELGRHSIGAWLFGILGLACLLYCVGIALAGYGTYFFLIWGGLGAASLLLAGIMASEKLARAIPHWIKGIFWSLFCLGLLLFCVVEGLILTQFNVGPRMDADSSMDADFCIVLGAQWKSNGPSEVLRRRLDAAVAYLKEHPDTRVIVSGGQGNNEMIAEAVGMQQYLMEAGIDQERILVEDRSSNTYENLIFSAEYFDREEDSVVIVTNNFHVFRALGIARKQGYGNVEGLAASSVEWMLPNNLLREFLGVLKDFVAGNL